MNYILIVVVLLAAGIGVYYYIKNKQNQEVEEKIEMDDKTYTLERMTAFVKQRLNEITKVNLYDIGLSEEELKRRKNKKYELKKALKGCTYGDVNDKKYIKELIYDLLYREYGVDETNVSKAIPFDIPSLLTAQDKFDILIYMYKNDFGYEALTELIKKYNLAELKYVAGETKPCYVITSQEISDIFEKENFVLTLSDKINVIVQRIYQHYKGYSSIDEVRDMNIDGVSGGVSGLPESFLSQVAQTDGDYLNQVVEHKVPRACDSIWIFFQGKSIRLEFLSFGTEAELKRVCQNIYKYNNPGQLSDTNGFKINEMKDGSRVVVVRPSFSETWAFFVRKFDVKRATLEQLIRIPGKEQAIDLLKYLVKGARVISLTGEQGCRKNNNAYGYDRKYIWHNEHTCSGNCIWVTLKKNIPNKKYSIIRETDTISGQMGLDVQKKTDGGVNIIRRGCNRPRSCMMIQAAQVASKFTLFTHHAKTFPLLVQALRNSLLKLGMFNDEKIAEEQVIGVLNFDIHLVKDFRGRRYIERVTECIPIEDKNEYTFEHRQEKTLEGKLDKFMDNATRFFSKTTNKELYKYVNILEYHDGTYVLTNPISDTNIREMRNNMDTSDIADFDKFVEENWGIKSKPYYDEEEIVETKKRGRKPKEN